MGARLMTYDKADARWVFYLNDYKIEDILSLLEKKTSIMIRNFYGEGDEGSYSTTDIVGFKSIDELKAFFSGRDDFFVVNKLMFDIENGHTIKFDDDYECQIFSNVPILENNMAKRVLGALGYSSEVLGYLAKNEGSYILINQDSTLEKSFKTFDDYIEYERA